MSKTKAKGKSLNKGLVQPGGKSPNPHSSRAFREFVESVVIAVILAFLFRSFEAEAFVIPTGSMAPTLQGRHMDVACPECGYRFRVGASSENADSEHRALVNAGLCPICRHPMIFDRRDPNQRSFNGDRILVSKFSYDLFEPERWDVIVFKYPGNAKQNYIKRLVGLPGEWIRIWRGDVYTKGSEDEEWRIARKSPRKLEAMLQLVDDTDYWSPSLIEAGWPSRWQPWTPEGAAGKVAWESSFAAEDDRHSQRFAVEGAEGGEAWLRYRHIIPTGDDWEQIRRGAAPGEWQEREGMLIADFYAYNTSEFDYGGPYTPPAFRSSQATGAHWVGDIALEAEVTVKSGEGELLLGLVEAGVHYTARIDVKTGEAVLLIDNGRGKFDGQEAAGQVASKSPTPVRGPGQYELRFANVDNQLTLWVDGDPIEFAGPTTYEPVGELRPHWTPDDPLDLAPAGLGVKGADVEARSLRVLRDVYYLALERGGQTNFDYNLHVTEEEIQSVFSDPLQWESTELFEKRRFVEFQMGEDEFFPLGDNSPQSKDARIWEPPPYVRRELLTGKALFIYWPHHWRRPVPFLPNFERMGFIR
jgi:signal peptidase I